MRFLVLFLCIILTSMAFSQRDKNKKKGKTKETIAPAPLEKMPNDIIFTSGEFTADRKFGIMCSGGTLRDLYRRKADIYYQFVSGLDSLPTSPIFTKPNCYHDLPFDLSLELDENSGVVACIDGKFGRINYKGDIISPFIYEGFEKFSTKTFVKKDGVWYLTEEKDTLKLKADYILGYLSEEDMYIFMKGDKILFMNGEGKYGSSFEPDRNRETQYDGLRSRPEYNFRIRKGNYWGIANHEGEIILPPIYSQIRSRTSLTTVCFDGKWGIIDPNTGLPIGEIKYDQLREQQINNVGVYYEGELCGLLNILNSEPITPALYRRISLRQNFIAISSFINDPGTKNVIKTGLIDFEGNVIQEPIYDRVSGTYNGRSLVEKDGLLGFIDNNGHIVIPIQFTNAEEFIYKKTAKVEIDGESYTIDLDGKRID